MRLKSLELQGFKSFPDRTKLSFDGDVCVVVGPNGSGKSNISDAIRWVLGEISSKNIRGNKMEDVIFGGTDTRRQMNYAEVSLTIDNLDGETRLDNDASEVTVTRRYMRTGDSEYMINRQPVRLRDIAELFMNTGIGRTGYSIIGQGKVAEIISQKSDERRTIFEEAAGISKYRFKKHEAELKMASVNDNLLRVGDILSELEGRVEPLEKEAERARRYLDLYERKKSADVSLWLYDIAALKEKLDNAERTYTIAKRELEIADEALASLEAQNEKLFLSSQENKLKSEELRRNITETTEERHHIESAEGVLENEITHIGEQIKSTELEIGIRKGELDKTAENSESLESERANADKMLSDAETDLENIENDVADTEDELVTLRLKLEANMADIASSEEKINAGRLRISELEGTRRADGERVASLNSEAESLRSTLQLYLSRIGKAKEKLTEYDKMKSELNDSIAGFETRERELAVSREGCADEINSIKMELSAIRQRSESMRRMEELFEGYAHSVRFVMEASEDKRLSGICGPVSRIISVSRRFGVAIETALGANIQNIVVEDEEAAKAAIALLKKQNAGRSTFYPLTSIKAQPLAMTDAELKKYNGYIGVASDIVENEEKYKSVVSYMLGRTVVFDNIDNASYMAKATGYRVRAVTLDGQIINAGGSFTGGSVKRDSGMLTRASELEELADKQKRHEIALKAAEEKAKEIASEIAAVSDRKADVAAKRDLVLTMYQAESTQSSVLESRYENDKRRLDAVEGDLERIGGMNRDVDSECERILGEEKALNSACDASRAHTAELEEGKAALLDKIGASQNRKNALLVRIAELRKDAEAAEKALGLATATRSSLGEKLEESERALYRLNEKLIASQNELVNLAQQKAETGKLVLQLEQELEKLAAEVNGFEEKQSAMRVKIKEKTTERERVFRESARLESLLSQLGGEQDKLTQRIWEDYELTHSAALTLGYPPVTADTRIEIAAVRDEAKNKLRALGNVNTAAIEEYAEVKARYEFLSGQYNDLETSRNDLSGIVTKLEAEMRVRFTSVFEEINVNFRSVFRELFGGGEAEIKLTDPENVLESGIDINVAPPGKIIKNLMLLSGGEQSFIAIALIFAILKVNPTPFCLFDEIEAALDEVNVTRFADYARRMSRDTQFIIITHRRGTMEVADMLYGVTMYEKGISRVFSLDVNEAEEKLGVKL